MCPLNITKLEMVKSFLQQNFGLENSDFKPTSPIQTFSKIEVRVKKEIVMLGHPDINPAVSVELILNPSGIPLSPKK